jgi:hypothetical protein
VLTPGESRVRCETVDYSGASAATVRVYATDVVASRGMGGWLLVRIDTASQPVGAACAVLLHTRQLYSGPLAGLPTSWDTAGSLMRSAQGETQLRYRITYTLSAQTPNSAQGGSGSLSLVWEARAT